MWSVNLQGGVDECSLDCPPKIRRTRQESMFDV